MGFDHVETMVGGHYAGLGGDGDIPHLQMYIIMKDGYTLEGWVQKEMSSTARN